MELRQCSPSRSPPYHALPCGSGFPYPAVSRSFRADSGGLTLTALVRRGSQFQKTGRGIKVAGQAALSKTQINARRFTHAPSPRTRPGLARVALFVSLTWFFTGWASPPRSTNGGAPEPAGLESAAFVDGVASYYGREHHGKKTANGEIFDMNKLTAAHRSLSFGSQVKVTNLSNQ